MRLNYAEFSMSANGEPTRVSHAFVKKNMVRYMRPHGRFAYWSCEKAALTLKLGLAASVAGSYCIFTLAVREPPALASCIQIYYFQTVFFINFFPHKFFFHIFYLTLRFWGVEGVWHRLWGHGASPFCPWRGHMIGPRFFNNYITPFLM